MTPYLELLEDALHNGEVRDDRTGTGTVSVFGRQLRFDLRDGFPVVTTKKIHLKSVFHELLWFISGATNVEYLQKHGVSIWDEWADDDGELGPVYGAQWRSWPDPSDGSIDQLARVIDNIRHNPTSRRHVVSAWNPADIDEMALPPCHILFQFYVSEGERLDCQMYQRSADLFLGVPFNIASYAALTSMVAQVCDLEPGEFVHTFGDAHIYKNHLDQVRTQLDREPFDRPTLRLNPEIDDIDDFTYDDITVEGYEHHPHISGDVSV